MLLIDRYRLQASRMMRLSLPRIGFGDQTRVRGQIVLRLWGNHIWDTVRRRSCKIFDVHLCWWHNNYPKHCGCANLRRSLRKPCLIPCVDDLKRRWFCWTSGVFKHGGSFKPGLHWSPVAYKTPIVLNVNAADVTDLTEAVGFWLTKCLKVSMRGFYLEINQPTNKYSKIV